MLTASCGDKCGGDCINGECVDGQCLCDIGYEGVACDVIALDFSGTYHATSKSFSECDNSAFNGFTKADGSFRFCERRGEERYCLEILLGIRPNRTYELLFVDLFINGVDILRIPDLNKGTYTTQGHELLICAESNNICEVMSLDPENGNIIWRREESTCVTTYIFEKF